MTRFARSWRSLAAGLLLAGAGLLSGQTSGERGQVLDVHRMVKVREDPTGERYLQKGDAIRIGQKIQTYRDSAIRMSFDDDGQLMLWPSTHVILQVPGPAGDRHGRCNRTEVAARIKVLRGDLQVDHDPNDPSLSPKVLEIETPHAFICLFGTSIQVHVDPDRKLTGVFVQQTGAQVRHLDAQDWQPLEREQQTFVRQGEKLRVTKAKKLTLPEPEARFNDSPLFDRIAF
jgi:hypothetical protein